MSKRLLGILLALVVILPMMTVTTVAADAEPAAPSGVTATVIGTSAVKVTWQKTAGAQFYQVWRMDKQGATPGACIGIYDANTVSCTSQNLQAGSTYYYRVRAYKKVGDGKIYGDYSAIVGATTKPAAPSGVTATAIGTSAVKVTWQKAAGAQFYQVWRMDKQGATPGACIGIYDANTVSCTSQNLQASSTYYYRVRAYKKVGDGKIYSNYSAIVGATTKSATSSGGTADKGESSTTTPSSPTVGGGTVYWTPSGEVYHSSKGCRTLSRSTTVESGTVAQAQALGKNRVCQVCGG